MMFDGISGRVTDALQRINGVQRISEASVAGALKDVKRALLVILVCVIVKPDLLPSLFLSKLRTADAYV